MKYIFYGSIVLCVVTILLLSLHYTTFGIFSLDPTSGAIITVPVSLSGTNTAYATSTIGPFTSTTFTGVKQLNYTVSFDLYIASSQNTDSYRVVFSNGKQIRDPSKVACPASATDFSSCDPNLGRYLTTDTATNDSLKVAANDLEDIKAKLLLNNANICMYLSPDKNDLNLMYYVAGNVWNENENNRVISGWNSGSSGSTPIYSINCGSSGISRSTDDPNDNCESGKENSGWINTVGPLYIDPTTLTIKNVPLQKPFRVTLAVDPNFIEVYINGDLVLTAKTPAASQIYTHPSDNKSQVNFLGPPMFSGYCKVGNIAYWNQVLPSKSIRLFSSTPADAKVFTQT